MSLHGCMMRLFIRTRECQMSVHDFNAAKQKRERKDIQRKILANDALVNLILDSGSMLSEPMTIEEFREWLRGMKEKSIQGN